MKRRRAGALARWAIAVQSLAWKAAAHTGCESGFDVAAAAVSLSLAAAAVTFAATMFAQDNRTPRINGMQYLAIFAQPRAGAPTQPAAANEPAVKTATDYYAANIGKVKTVDGLVGNYRLLSYALKAYGLGDEINSTALIRQVLSGGVSNPKSLANTLPDPRWKAFATAFNFPGDGAASISTAAAVATTATNYAEQQLESDAGQSNAGVQLALYFQRVAPTVTNNYGILGDANLLEVAQTIFGLAPTLSASDIDAEAASVGKLLPLADLQDPAKLKQLTERFTAMYDLNYGGASGSSTALTVSGGASSSSQTSAASTILSDVINANASALAGGSPFFSNALMTSLQGLQLGGF